MTDTKAPSFAQALTLGGFIIGTRDTLADELLRVADNLAAQHGNYEARMELLPLVKWLREKGRRVSLTMGGRTVVLVPMKDCEPGKVFRFEDEPSMLFAPTPGGKPLTSKDIADAWDKIQGMGGDVPPGFSSSTGPASV